MSVKKTIISSFLIAGMSISAFAYAQKLTIFNNTDFPSTSRINGHCSRDILGSAGVTPKRTKKDIEEWQLKLACMASPEKCIADVYLTNNCKGDPITTVTFSVSKGIINVTPPKNGYSETHQAFYIQINAPEKA